MTADQSREQRYFDVYHADGYWLSHSPGERAVDQHPTRGERTTPSCPACYRPLPKPGYCTRCETTGAADRHRSRR